MPVLPLHSARVCLCMRMHGLHITSIARAVQLRSQDVAHFVRTFATLSAHRTQMAWQYMTANRNLFEAAFGGTHADNQRSVNRLLADIASNFATEDKLDAVKSYFESQIKQPSGSSTAVLPPYVQDALSSVRRRMWSRKHLVPDMCDWLKKKVDAEEVYYYNYTPEAPYA